MAKLAMVSAVGLAGVIPVSSATAGATSVSAFQANGVESFSQTLVGLWRFEEVDLVNTGSTPLALGTVTEGGVSYPNWANSEISGFGAWPTPSNEAGTFGPSCYLWNASGTSVSASVVAAGSSCTLALWFRPVRFGIVTADEAITDSAGSILTLSGLIGTGVGGYWISNSEGDWAGEGWLPNSLNTQTSPPPALNHPIVGMATDWDSGGFWQVASDGGIFTNGDAPYEGSMGNVHLNQPIVGMAMDPATNGYWEVASDGGIFTFDSNFYGSTGSLRLNKPIVGMAATPDGGGYWLVASDGGVFSFGDAKFFGSTGNIRLNKPVVAMEATPDGKGYWLTASDGGVFTFGDARFYGSEGAVPLNSPILGAVASPTGGGYWMVAGDGGIFTLGDAPFGGSAVAPGSSAVAMSADTQPIPPAYFEGEQAAGRSVQRPFGNAPLAEGRSGVQVGPLARH